MSEKKKNKKQDIQDELRESTHKIFLAGLGALAMVGEESGKLFDKLVDKGEKYESDKDSTMGKAKKTVDDAKHRAEDAWSKVEGAFTEKVGVALKSLGVPTREEINHLSDRVDALMEAIEKLDNNGKETKAKTASSASKSKTSTKK